MSQAPARAGALVLIEKVSSVPDPGIGWAAVTWTEPSSLRKVEMIVGCSHRVVRETVLVERVLHFKFFIIKDKCKSWHIFPFCCCELPPASPRIHASHGLYRIVETSSLAARDQITTASIPFNVQNVAACRLQLVACRLPLVAFSLSSDNSDARRFVAAHGLVFPIGYIFDRRIPACPAASAGVVLVRSWACSTRSRDNR